MNNPKRFVYPLRRENLQLVIKRVEASGKQNKRETLRMNRFYTIESELRQRDKKGAAIIYCPTVKMVKRLAKWLKARGYLVSKYHGKMKRKARQKAQSLFMSGNRPIIVATNAFGLGIDKPDVRLIIHAGLPLSMDGYVQEIGRAGRDGKESRCVLIYAKTDFAENERILRKNGGETVGKKRKRLHALRKLLQSEQCIWQQVEQYFGQKKGERCKKCCHCKQR